MQSSLVSSFLRMQIHLQRHLGLINLSSFSLVNDNESHPSTSISSSHSHQPAQSVTAPHAPPLQVTPIHEPNLATLGDRSRPCSKATSYKESKSIT